MAQGPSYTTWLAGGGQSWQYGSTAQPSTVEFIPYGNFGMVLGQSAAIGQLHFQNAVGWPVDDPTATYWATLSAVLATSFPNSSSNAFSWDLQVQAVNGGTDVLSGLPSNVYSIPVIENGNTYYLNLLGFYSNGVRVTQLSSGPWAYQSADLMASFTTEPAGTPLSHMPEPAPVILTAGGLLLLAVHRRLRSR